MSSSVFTIKTAKVLLLFQRKIANFIFELMHSHLQIILMWLNQTNSWQQFTFTFITIAKPVHFLWLLIESDYG